MRPLHTPTDSLGSADMGKIWQRVQVGSGRVRVGVLWISVLSVVFAAQGNGQEQRFEATRLELEKRDQPVTEDDLQILLRTDELLAEPSVWNRDDDRNCGDDEATGVRSLFCALQRASVDVLGTYDHRRVSLQEVRFAIEEATEDYPFQHRLRDYNNLPGTEFSDIKNVLAAAQDRVKSRLPRPERWRSLIGDMRQRRVLANMKPP